MPAAFQDKKYANRRAAHISKIQWATHDHGFAHATESGNHGMREPVEVDIKPITVESNSGVKNLQRFETAFKISLMQTDIGTLKNVYILGKFPHQVQTKNHNGDYFAWVENTADPGVAATGSRELGLSWKFSIDTSKRNIELTYGGQMYKEEYDFGLANAAAASTGSTAVAGVDLGTATTSYDVTKFRRANFVWAKVDGAKVGDFKEIKLDIESFGDKDELGRQCNDGVKVHAEITMRQTAIADQQAASDHAVGNYDIILMTAEGEQFKFMGGACSVMPEMKFGDKENYIKLTLDGMIYNNTDEAAATNIVFNTGAKTVTFNFETP